MKKLLLVLFFASIVFAGCKKSETNNTEIAAPVTTEAPVVSTTTAPVSTEAPAVK